MTGITTVAVVVIAALGAITVVVSLAVVAATVLVSAASRYEERHQSLTGPASGLITRQARRVLLMPVEPSAAAVRVMRRVRPRAGAISATHRTGPRVLANGHVPSPGLARSAGDAASSGVASSRRFVQPPPVAEPERQLVN